MQVEPDAFRRSMEFAIIWRASEIDIKAHDSKNSAGGAGAL
jgi:hypothetical protein